MAASSLQAQLDRQAAQAGLTPQSTRQTDYPSLLFDQKEARQLDQETIRQLALNGLDEIRSSAAKYQSSYDGNQTVADVLEGLLEDQSGVVIEAMTLDEVSDLDLRIRSVLPLLGRSLLQRASQKIIEYLLRRYSIHKRLQVDVIHTVLPYLRTRVFVRLMITLQLGQKECPHYAWLVPQVCKPKTPLSMSVLAQRLNKDPTLFVTISKACQHLIRQFVPKEIVGDARQPSTDLGEMYASFLTVLGADFIAEVVQAQVTAGAGLKGKRQEAALLVAQTAIECLENASDVQKNSGARSIAIADVLRSMAHTLSIVLAQKVQIPAKALVELLGAFMQHHRVATTGQKDSAARAKGTQMLYTLVVLTQTQGVQALPVPLISDLIQTFADGSLGTQLQQAFEQKGAGADAFLTALINTVIDESSQTLQGSNGIVLTPHGLSVEQNKLLASSLHTTFASVDVPQGVLDQLVLKAIGSVIVYGEKSQIGSAILSGAHVRDPMYVDAVIAMITDKSQSKMSTKLWTVAKEVDSWRTDLKSETQMRQKITENLDALVASTARFGNEEGGLLQLLTESESNISTDINVHKLTGALHHPSVDMRRNAAETLVSVLESSKCELADRVMESCLTYIPDLLMDTSADVSRQGIALFQVLRGMKGFEAHKTEPIFTALLRYLWQSSMKTDASASQDVQAALVVLYEAYGPAEHLKETVVLFIATLCARPSSILLQKRNTLLKSLKAIKEGPECLEILVASDLRGLGSNFSAFLLESGDGFVENILSAGSSLVQIGIPSQHIESALAMLKLAAASELNKTQASKLLANSGEDNRTKGYVPLWDRLVAPRIGTMHTAHANATGQETTEVLGDFLGALVKCKTHAEVYDVMAKESRVDGALEWDLTKVFLASKAALMLVLAVDDTLTLCDCLDSLLAFQNKTILKLCAPIVGTDRIATGGDFVSGQITLLRLTLQLNRNAVARSNALLFLGASIQGMGRVAIKQHATHLGQVGLFVALNCCDESRRVRESAVEALQALARIIEAGGLVATDMKASSKSAKQSVVPGAVVPLPVLSALLATLHVAATDIATDPAHISEALARYFQQQSDDDVCRALLNSVVTCVTSQKHTYGVHQRALQLVHDLDPVMQQQMFLPFSLQNAKFLMRSLQGSMDRASPVVKKCASLCARILTRCEDGAASLTGVQKGQLVEVFDLFLRLGSNKTDEETPQAIVLRSFLTRKVGSKDVGIDDDDDAIETPSPLWTSLDTYKDRLYVRLLTLGGNINANTSLSMQEVATHTAAVLAVASLGVLEFVGRILRDHMDMLLEAINVKDTDHLSLAVRAGKGIFENLSPEQAQSDETITEGTFAKRNLEVVNTILMICAKADFADFMELLQGEGATGGLALLKDTKRKGGSAKKAGAASDDLGSLATSLQNMISNISSAIQGLLGMEGVERKKTSRKQPVTTPSGSVEISVDALEYTQQNIMIALQRVWDRVLAWRDSSATTLDLDSIPVFSAMRADVAVTCLRISRNPATQHQALNVLNTMARLQPHRVVHEVMPIFTFMSTSTIRHDDNYTFKLIKDTICSIIPAIMSGGESSAEENTERAVKQLHFDIIKVFVDAWKHIPAHRRHDLYSEVVATMGAADYLHVMIAMLLRRADTIQMRKGLSSSSEAEADGDDYSTFAHLLMHDYNAATQLQATYKLLLVPWIAPSVVRLPEDGDMYSDDDDNDEDRLGGNLHPDDLLLSNMAIGDGKRGTSMKTMLRKTNIVLFAIRRLDRADLLEGIVTLERSGGQDALEALQVEYLRLLEACLLLQASLQGLTSGDTTGSLASRILHTRADHAECLKGYKRLGRWVLELMDRVNGLMAFTTVVSVVDRLVRHSDAVIRRKALLLLNRRIEASKGQLTKTEIESLLSFFPSILYIISAGRLNAEDDGESEDEEDSEPETVINRQVAVLVCENMARFLAKKYPQDFDRGMALLLEDKVLRTGNLQLTASVLCAIGTGLRELGGVAIIYVNPALDAALTFMDAKFDSVHCAGDKHKEQTQKKARYSSAIPATSNSHDLTMLATAAMTCLRNIIASGSKMLGTALPRIIAVVTDSCLNAEADLLSASNADEKGLIQRGQGLRDLLVSTVPIRQLLPALRSCVQSTVDATYVDIEYDNSERTLDAHYLHRDLGLVMRMLASIVNTRLKVKEVLDAESDLLGMVSSVLETEITMLVVAQYYESAARIERAAIDALLEITLKQNNTSFKPFFQAFLDWGYNAEVTASEDDEYEPRILLARRRVTHRALEDLSQRLTFLFTQYFALAWDELCNDLEFGADIDLEDLDSIVPVQKGRKPSKKESAKGKKRSLDDVFAEVEDDDVQEQRQAMEHRNSQLIMLRQQVIATLRSCFEHNGTGAGVNVLSKDRFRAVLNPLMMHLDRQQCDGSNAEMALRLEDEVVPTVVNLLAGCHDDQRRQEATQAYLMKLRSSSTQTRVAALHILQRAYGAIGQEYLNHLPETIPFIAEILEDDDPEVEQAAQEAVATVEEYLGESLKKYLL
eukprot:Clim_evm14s66 gene=Clim_evmTU14s66